MARIWLVLMLAFALATGGVASAAAADCPMQERVAASADACCPDAAKSDHRPEQQKQKSDGCPFVMACCSVSLVAPTIASMHLPSPDILVSAQRIGEPAPPSGYLQELFRPPRSI